jgi:hypothetical protein
VLPMKSPCVAGPAIAGCSKRTRPLCSTDPFGVFIRMLQMEFDQEPPDNPVLVLDLISVIIGVIFARKVS